MVPDARASRGHLPVLTCRGRLGTDPDRGCTVTSSLLLLLICVVALVAVILLFRRRSGRRRRAMQQLLDAADAMEARLRTARSEIEAVVGDDVEDPVRDALREMLRQRLWLREHGSNATLAEIDQVRRSIDDARSRIDLQLSRIERARAPVA